MIGRNTMTALGASVLASLAAPALACPPPPPGWVAPSAAKVRESFVHHSTDIVYGIIRNDRSGRRYLDVYHVYKGAKRRGERIYAKTGYDFPVPVCTMAPPPPAKDVGVYGVFAIRYASEGLVLIPPAHVEAMIRQRLIRSARAR